MKLKNAARYFDTCPVYDAYTGALLFKIQTSTFLESSAEGSTAAKRVISLDPALNVPEHSCILALDQIWITGASNPDEWQGTAIRKAYWTKLATETFTLLTPGQAALSNAGQQLFGSKKYLRESLNGATDSELDPVWEISLSKSVQADRGFFLKSANTLYRVRVDYNDVDGFKTCQSDEVDEPVTQVLFTSSKVYNPITDEYAPSHISVTAITLDYSKAYTKSAITDIKPEQGDLCMVVAKLAVAPSVGVELEIQSGKFAGYWRTLAVLSEHDSWKLHIRRV
jgi:hypothetical protein